MTGERWGSVDTVEGVVALRAVSSGHLHECPDGRVGIYTGAQAVGIGETMTLHTREAVRLDCDTFGAMAAGQAVQFNFTTQLVVSSGTVVGTFISSKAHNGTKALCALNQSGQPVDSAVVPTTTTTTA